MGSDEDEEALKETRNHQLLICTVFSEWTMTVASNIG